MPDNHRYDHKFHDRKPEPVRVEAPKPAPFGLSNSVYVVIRLGGERHYIEKMTPKELAEWARGLDVTIVEYRYAAIVHTPPPPKKEAAK
jgi:hypothetical protein